MKRSISIILSTFIVLTASQYGYAKNSEETSPQPSTQLNTKELIKQIPTKAVSFSIIPATTAARDWLKLMDQDKFAQCWQQASVLVRKSVNEKDFVESAKRSRLPLGSLIKREITMVEPKTKLPGSPKGKYVIATFKAKFHNKADPVTEILMLQVDPDNQWRVAGYFLR